MNHICIACKTKTSNKWFLSDHNETVCESCWDESKYLYPDEVIFDPDVPITDKNYKLIVEEGMASRYGKLNC